MGGGATGIVDGGQDVGDNDASDGDASGPDASGGGGAGGGGTSGGGAGGGGTSGGGAGGGTDTTVRQQAYVKASNTEANDHFGLVALSADGNTMAVGAPGESSSAIGVGGDQADNGASSSGAVYIFVRGSGVWTQQAYVKSSNADFGDYFGSALVLSDDGDTLAVGAPGESSSATGVGGDGTNDAATSSGAAYVFVRTGGVWAEQAYVKASNTDANDRFGSAVALAGDGRTLVVGATGEASAASGVGGDQSDNSLSTPGAAYVFVRAAGGWAQQAYLKASQPAPNSYFGAALATTSDGNLVAVGGGGGGKPVVSVFARTGTAWALASEIRAAITDNGDAFGCSLSLAGDGNTLAVGAFDEDSNAKGVGGDATNNAAPTSGAAYVFTRGAGAWTQQAYIKASNTDATDVFSRGGVALDGAGDTLLVTAYGEDGNATGIDGDQANNAAMDSGAAYLLTRSGGTWTQQAYIKASNTGAQDEFGASAAMSKDGSTFAIGATFERSSAVGVGGNQADNSANGAGAAYVFTTTP